MLNKTIKKQNLEAQNQYFGKRGMSLSVEVFMMYNNGYWHKQVYLVAIDKCDQSLIDTLNVAEVVFTQFSKDFPGVEQVNLKSDNAG